MVSPNVPTNKAKVSENYSLIMMKNVDGKGAKVFNNVMCFLNHIENVKFSSRRKLKYKIVKYSQA